MTQIARRHLTLGRAIAVFALITGASVTLLLLVVARSARAAEITSAVQLNPQLAGWAFMAAALCTGLAALAAGYAVARVGSAAIGAIAEKPELFGRVLVLVGLAEGIAIYGLIVSILILNRIA